MLGRLCGYLVKAPPELMQGGTSSAVEALGKLITFHLESKSAHQRMAVGLVLYSWAKEEGVRSVQSDYSLLFSFHFDRRMLVALI